MNDRIESVANLDELTANSSDNKNNLSNFFLKLKKSFISIFAKSYYFCIFIFTLLQVVDQFNLYSFSLAHTNNAIILEASSYISLPLIKSGIMIIFCIFLVSTYCRTLLIKNYVIIEEKLKRSELAMEVHEQNFTNEKRKRIEFLRSVLIFIFKALKAHSLERISLYVFNPNREEFDIISRYSYNTRYNARSRVSYPATEGCIATAWEHGTAFYAASEDNDEVVKDEIYSEFNVPKTVSSQFRMLARTVYGFRIDDDNNNATAVLIFESMTLGNFEENVIFDVISGYTDIIKTLVLELKNDLPTASTARDVGL